jgi:hypothetical protein
MVVGRAGKVAKAINLPPFRKLLVKMEHILSGRTKEGLRAIQSGQKTAFSGMNPDQIKNAIKEVYEVGQKVETQGGRVRIQGATKDGLKIEMWVNLKTKEIETAYPTIVQK